MTAIFFRRSDGSRVRPTVVSILWRVGRRLTVVTAIRLCEICGDPADGHVHRDGCLVTTEPFAELLRAFVLRWTKERPQPAGQFGVTEEPPIRALAWLSAELSRVAPYVTEATLKGLLERGERTKVLIELRVADAIAVALDRPDILYDPRIVVYRNPQASKDAECLDASGQPLPVPPGACCSGSSRRLAA